MKNRYARRPPVNCLFFSVCALLLICVMLWTYNGHTGRGGGKMKKPLIKHEELDTDNTLQALIERAYAQRPKTGTTSNNLA